MVAVVAGNGLGLFNTSATVLGGSGILGQGTLGQSGRSYVNAVTGNLVLQSGDEMLSGRGSDLLQLRTYNSRGALDGGSDADSDGWRWDGERTVQFSGTAGERNVSGTLVRTLGDGHSTSYVWNATTATYVSTEGDGAHDSAKFDDAAKQWVWTDGSTRLQERYDDSVSNAVARLKSQKDVTGNVISFTYDSGNRLQTITDTSSGQQMVLVYSGTPAKLARIDTYELKVNTTTGKLLDPPVVNTAPVKQVEYSYDNGRLGTVKTILNPGAATPIYFFTTYGYGSSTSSLVSSVTQGDSTTTSFRVDFTYDSSNRILTVTDANGKQKFSYGSTSTDIAISDAADKNTQTWTYTYDATSKQLTQVASPAPTAGAARLVTKFQYDASGNLIQVTDARGFAVVYQYDAKGNRTLERDAKGDTLSRTFDANNQVLTETHYRTPDPDGAGAGVAGDPVVTRYAYDLNTRLRFAISAEGRVTENRYGSDGLLLASIHYTTDRYSAAAFGESDLAAWAGAITDKSHQQLTEYTYDFRGNLSKRVDFANVDTASGAGTLDAAATVTEFVYDGHGELVHTIAVRGAARDQRTQTSIVFDGLGREISRTDGSGTQTTSYDDAHHKITLTTAANLVVVSAYDLVGHLIAVSQTGSGTTRTTQYFYDAQGRPQLTLDPQGNRRFSFYDAAGRLTFAVDPTGAAVGYTYDQAGHVLTSTQYAVPVGSTDSWVTLDSGTPPKVTGMAKTTLVLGTAAGAGIDLVMTPDTDRTTTYTYDQAGRLSTTTDAASVVTTTNYDGTSHVTSQQIGGATTRFYYDGDGNRVGVLDPRGYLTEYKFGGAGQLTETVRYNQRSSAATDASAPVWIGVTNQTATGGKPFSYPMHAVDADGDTLSFSLLGTPTPPAWLSLDTSVPGSPVLKGTPPAKLTSYTVKLRVSDNGIPTPRTADTTVTITVANSAPTWSPLPDATVPSLTAGYSLVLPAASDNETAVGSLTYSIDPALLPPGLSFSGRTISGTPTTAGTYTITARVTDAGTPPLFTERSFVLQVTNKGPSWPAVPPQTGNRNSLFSLPVTASDLDGTSLTYRIVNGPSWLSLNAGVLSGTPPADAPQNNFDAVKLEAKDEFGEISEVSFTVNVVNRAPTWPTLDILQKYAGTPYNYQIPPATDADGDTLVYSVTGLPAGVTMSASGLITGTSNAVGDFPLTVTVSDGHGASLVQQVMLTQYNVAPVYNRAPTVPQITAGVPFSFQLPTDTFIDPNGDALNGILSITFIQGLNYSGALSQTFSGTLANPGTYSVTLVTTDSHGANAFGTFSFTVIAPPPPTGGGGGGGGGGTPPGGPPIQQNAAPGAPTGSPAPKPEPLPVAGSSPVLAPAPVPQVVPVPTAAPLPLVAAAAVAAPVDPLASLRPTAGAQDLHSYHFYDAQGRLTASVNERGFLSETVYDEQSNKQQNISYMGAVAVAAGNTLTNVRDQALSTTLLVKSETTKVDYDGFGRVTKRTAADGTTFTTYAYDTAGRVIRQVSASGIAAEQRAERTVYDAFGDVIAKLGGEGDASLATTATPEQIAAAIAQYGQRFVYDGLGQLTNTLDANPTGAADQQHATRNFYDADGRLTFSVNAVGEVSELTYNAMGQVTTQRSYGKRLEDPALLAGLMDGSKGQPELVNALAAMPADKNRVVAFTYDQRGQVKTSTDALGFVTTSTYDVFGHLATQQRTIAKAAGSAAAKTTTTQFDYDLNGNLLSRTDDLGGLNFNTQTGYDAFGRVIRSVDAVGAVTKTEYLASGRVIEVTAPVAGSLTRTTHDEYDPFSRVLTHIDPSGKITTYDYDPVTRTMTVKTPEGIVMTTTRTRFGETLSVTDGKGGVTKYAYNRNGQVTTVTDALGVVVTTNGYDTNGLLKQVTDARGIITTFTYDAANRLLTRRVDPKVAGVNPKGLDLFTTYEFDAFGQQVKVTEGSGSNGARLTVYRYDLNGRVFQTITDPNGLALATTTSYDGVGEVVQVAQGTLSAPNQLVTQYVFNKLGQRIKEIAAPSPVFGAGSAQARDLTTEYRYNTAGRVSRRIDANGQSTWFIYNDAGELTYTVNALGEVSQSVYDSNGRVAQSVRYGTRLAVGTVAGFGDALTTVTPTADASVDHRSYFVSDDDGRPRFTLQSVDASNWVISETRRDNNGNVVETRRYDKPLSQARVTAIAASGSVTVAEVAAELTTLGYDDATPSTLTLIQRTRFAYDAANQLRFTVDALGDVSETAYDAAGNAVMTVRYAVRPTLAAFDVKSINGKVDRNNIANQVSHYTFDTAGRLHFSIHVLASDGIGKATQQLVYEQRRDAVGRVVLTTAYDTVLGAMPLVAGVPDYSDATVAAKLSASASDRRTAHTFDSAGREVYRIDVLAIDGSGVATQQIVTRQTFDALHLTGTTAYAAVLLTLSDYKQATLDAAVSGLASDPMNRSTQFIYDKAGQLRFTVAPDKSFSESIHDALGQVVETRQFDRLLDSGAQMTEDSLAGRRGGKKVGDGVTRGMSYVYDAAGRLLSSTDAGSVDAGGTFLRHTERYTYDAFGNRSTLTDKSGKTWNYDYDPLGRLRTQTSPDVTVQVGGEVGATRLVTLLEYDTLGNLKTRTEAQNTTEARVTAYDYDLLGRQTMTTLPGWYDPATGRVETASATGRFQRTLETKYDALGNDVRHQIRTGASSVINEYKTYDVLGRVVHDVDVLGNVSAFDYNAFGEQKTVTRYSKSVGAPAGGATGLWTTSALVTAIGTDALARTVTIAYDNLGRKTQVTQPTVSSYYNDSAGNYFAIAVPVTGAATTSYEYNAFGEVHRQAVKVNEGEPSRDTWHYFDVMGHETRTIELAAGSGAGAQGVHTERSFDNFGNLVKTIEYANMGDSGASGVFTPPVTPGASSKDRVTGFTYDALNRQTSVQRFGLSYTRVNGTVFEEVTTAMSQATTVATTTYDVMGRIHTKTDGLNNTSTTEYNALGQVISVTEPARQTAAAGTAVDPFVTQVFSTPVTTFTLNAFGQICVQERSAGGGLGSGATLTTKTSYDAAGNAISSKDANDNEKLSQYDYSGRVLKETRAISAALGGLGTVAQTLERRFGYDLLGRQKETVDVYLDIRVDPSAAAVQRQSGQRSVYNAFGEVTEERRVSGLASVTALSALSGPLVAKYTYDNAGHMTQKVAGDGTTSYLYNFAGQVTRQEQLGTAIDGSGAATAVTRITESQYDLRGRVVLQILPTFTSTQTQIVPNDSTRRTVLTLNLLAYDRWGNVLTRSVDGLVYDDSSVRHDQSRTTQFEYNADNQVIVERQPTVTVLRENNTTYRANLSHELHYDLLGRAVRERDVVDDAGTAVVEATELRSRTRKYNATGQLLEEIDATGIKTEYRYDSNGNRVGTRNARGTVFIDEFDKNGNLTRHSVLRRANRTSEYRSGQDPATTPLSLVTINQYQYDQANRRTASGVTISENSAQVFSYTQFDERGLGLKQLNASGVLMRAEFDVLGNKVGERDANTNAATFFNGNGQNSVYDTTGDFTVGRLVSTTVVDSVYVSNKPMTYTYNGFGQLVREQRAGTNQLGAYDRFLEYQTNGLLKSTQDRLAASGTVVAAAETLTYEYTALGERATERFSKVEHRSTGDVEVESRFTTTAYDELGRMTKVTAPAAANPGRRALNSLDYSYDEFGNRRRIAASYEAGNIDHWFTYDAEGRMKIVDGQFDSKAGGIRAGHDGTVVSYDALGQRLSVEKFDRARVFSNDPSVHGVEALPAGDYEPGTTIRVDEFRGEQYSYNDLGQLTLIQQRLVRRNGTQIVSNVPGVKKLDDSEGQWKVLETRLFDLRGAMFNRKTYTALSASGNPEVADVGVADPTVNSTTGLLYRDDGLLLGQATSKTGFDIGGSLTNHYDNAGVLRSYEYTPESHITDNAGLSTFRTDQIVLNYTYQYSTQLGGYKETQIKVHATKAANSDATLPGDGVTNDFYDGRGRLVKQVMANPAETRTLNFRYDNSGHIVTKYESVKPAQGDEKKGIQDYFYANGQQVGTLGTGTLETAQFNGNFTPISAAYPAAIPGSYVVATNDTLAGIAKNVFGDAQLWYLIADANSLRFGPGDTLPQNEVGKTYRIPNVVANAHNNAGTFRPYSAADIIGSSAPTPGLPPPPGAACGGIGTVLATVIIVAVAAVVSYFTAGALSAQLGPIVAGAIAGAAGSASSQVAGWGMGMQQGISGQQVLTGAVTGALGGAATLVESGVAAGSTDSVFNAVGGFKNSFANVAQDFLVGTVGSALSGNSVDLQGALFSLGTQLALHGARVAGGFGATEAGPSWGDAVERVAANALNPDSGWVFNAKSRDWASIASQAAGAFASVATGKAIAQIKASREHSISDAAGEVADAAAALRNGAEALFNKVTSGLPRMRLTASQVVFAGDAPDEPVNIPANVIETGMDLIPGGAIEKFRPPTSWLDVLKQKGQGLIGAARLIIELTGMDPHTHLLATRRDSVGDAIEKAHDGLRKKAATPDKPRLDGGPNSGEPPEPHLAPTPNEPVRGESYLESNKILEQSGELFARHTLEEAGGVASTFHKKNDFNLAEFEFDLIKEPQSLTPALAPEATLVERFPNAADAPGVKAVGEVSGGGRVLNGGAKALGIGLNALQFVAQGIEYWKTGGVVLAHDINGDEIGVGTQHTEIQKDYAQPNVPFIPYSTAQALVQAGVYTEGKQFVDLQSYELHTIVSGQIVPLGYHYEHDYKYGDWALIKHVPDPRGLDVIN